MKKKAGPPPNNANIGSKYGMMQHTESIPDKNIVRRIHLFHENPRNDEDKLKIIYNNYF